MIVENLKQKEKKKKKKRNSLSVLEEWAGNLPGRNYRGAVRSCFYCSEIYHVDITEAFSAHSHFLFLIAQSGINPVQEA